MHRRLWIALAALAASASLTMAQTTQTSAPPAAARRAPSPGGTAATQVGGKWSTPDKDGNTRYEGGNWIEITYSRPVLRGRTDIFGKGADYGKKINSGSPVWRTGANATTKLKTDVPLEIGGKRLAPGEYDLFTELKETGWTLIVSTQPTQEKYDPNEKTKIWGSYGYDSKYDVVRTPMTMVRVPASHEQFTIGFIDMTDKGGKIAMVWEHTGATVAFTLVQ